MHKIIKENILQVGEYFDSLIFDLQHAKKQIDLEVYIFADDNIGHRVCAALCEASIRGVKVRVLVDGAGSYNWGGSIQKKMIESGVEARVFHPLPWGISHYIHSHKKISIFSKLNFLFLNINKRNHRKTCVIDHHIAYIGSANIAESYLASKDGGGNWRDLSLRIENVDTRKLTLAFEKAWNRFPLYQRAKLSFKHIPKNPIFRLNYLMRQRRILYKNLLSSIRNAGKKIWIANAYFSPDIKLLNALKYASKHGVEVKILLPHHSDVFIYPIVSRLFYQELLKSGVQIFEYNKGMLHAKAFIIDNLHMIGSSNLNARSIRHDLEVDVVLQTESAKNKLEEIFIKDLQDSLKIDQQFSNKINWYQKIIAWAALYVRYWI